MNEHPRFPRTQDKDRAAHPPSLPTRPAEAEPDPRIAAYLDQVFLPLGARLPAAACQERRAELAAHLEALIAAHMELGSDPEVAVRAALEQAGEPRRLAGEWSRAWGRPAGQAFTPGPEGLAAAPALMGGAIFSAFLLISLDRHMGHNLFEMTLGGALLPLLAGALVGWGRGRHRLGNWWGMLLIGLVGVGISLTMQAADPRPPVTVAIRALMWLLAASGTAGLGALTTAWREGWPPLAARR